MQTFVKQVKDFFGLEFGFERFTEKAINAINYSRNEAVRKGSSQVELEHLLSGLLADPTTTSARLLQANGVKQDIKTDEHSFENSQKIELNSEIKFILELALQVVRLRSGKSIGTEHLLWGLVRLAETGNTTISDLFKQYEVNLTTLNKQLTEEVQ